VFVEGVGNERKVGAAHVGKQHCHMRYEQQRVGGLVRVRMRSFPTRLLFGGAVQHVTYRVLVGSRESPVCSVKTRANLVK
jgi:hypothetical protein